MPVKNDRIPETVINQEAAKWCMDRGYRIYPVPVEF